MYFSMCNHEPRKKCISKHTVHHLIHTSFRDTWKKTVFPVCVPDSARFILLIWYE